MLYRQTTSVLASLVALMFSVALVLPCLCSTATAQEAETTAGEASDCCDDSKAESDQEPSEDGEHDGCCCDGSSSCISNVDSEAPSGHEAVTSSFESDEIGAFTTWWTPDLVAILWVVDRLTDLSDKAPPPRAVADSVRPDESDTYLQQATLLL